MSATDEESRRLVEKFLGTRDEPSFRALYRAHTPRMLALALRLTGGNRAEAEDAVQEAWMRSTAALANFQWRSSLSTWLGGFVVNCHRELSRRSFEPLDDDAAAIAAPQDSADLELLVRSLPDRCREVLVLHDIEGYTHEEIGRSLGIADGTSKHHLFRARKLLAALALPRKEKNHAE